jgi:hypothetical protein
MSLPRYAASGEKKGPSRVLEGAMVHFASFPLSGGLPAIYRLSNKKEGNDRDQDENGEKSHTIKVHESDTHVKKFACQKAARLLRATGLLGPSGFGQLPLATAAGFSILLLFACADWPRVADLWPLVFWSGVRHDEVENTQGFTKAVQGDRLRQAETQPGRQEALE